MRQFLVERLSVRGPSMLPEFLAMVRDNHNQGVVENAELLQFPGQLLQAGVVVQNFAVVTVESPLDEPVGIQSITFTHRTADHSAATVAALVHQVLESSVEFSRFRGVG